ncbi:MAG: crossover junction endodeoxyribonuclease RuvC [Acidimicrobiales bacterium]|nr:crossover junction endodeoxyribonuclease RuvC [Acidimicrobiales bacterium]
MFTLGIDPGLSRCGYGFVDDSKELKGPRWKAVAAGVITTSKDLDLPIRLAELYKGLSRLMMEYKPEVVVVERVIFQVNAKTAMSVGQASGLALVAAANLGVEVIQYSSNEVKQATVGYGAATKEQVRQMVAKLVGLDVISGPPDVSDALALALCHLSTCGLRKAIDKSLECQNHQKNQLVDVMVGQKMGEAP